MALLDPLFYVGGSIIVFFSAIPISNEDEVGIFLIISTLFILFGYYFFEKELFNNHFARNMRLEDPKVQFSFLLVCLFISFTSLSYLLITNGQLLQLIILINPLINSQKNAANSFLHIIDMVPIWGLIIGRIWLNANVSNLKKIKAVWYILFLSITILRLSEGVRGGLVILFLSVLITDLWFEKSAKVNTFKTHKTFYLILSFFTFLGILFMTFHRTETFNSADDMINSIENTISEKNTDPIFQDFSITENNEISYLIDKYLFDPAFFSGIYAQIVNPIPRVLWKDKPITFGERLGLERMGRDVPSSGWGMSAGIVGEAIFNGGFFGLIFFSFLFGALFQKIKITLYQNNNAIHITTAIMFLSFSYALIRGEWNWGFNFPLYNAAFAILLLKVVKVYNFKKRNTRLLLLK